jgi:cephalosporin hydroxylase
VQALEAAKQFHRDFYESQVWHGPTHFLGVPVYKPPTDLWAVQQIISVSRPTVIVETGTAFGGSALWYASIMDLLGIEGMVFTIDLFPQGVDDGYVFPKHPKLNYILGDSISEDTFMKVINMAQRGIARGTHNWMVVLDSDHTQDHVFQELLMWSPLVSKGQFLIVEDTRVDQPDWMGNARAPMAGRGPGKALEQFMRGTDRFKVNRHVQPALTFHPGGYLECVK